MCSEAVALRDVVQSLADAFADVHSAGDLFADFAVKRFGRSFGEIDAATGQVNVIAVAGACDQAFGIDHDRIGALARFLQGLAGALAKNGDIWLHMSRMHGCLGNCNAGRTENFEKKSEFRWLWNGYCGGGARAGG